MNKYKIKTAIRDFIHAGLVIYTFFVVYYLLFVPDKTTEQIIFICVFIGLVAWITTLLREKRKLQIDLLLSLRADLLLKSDYTKAGVASKYKEEKDTLVHILGLLGYEKEPLETVEDIDNLLKEFRRLRQE
jgi:hypothetical protein